MERLKNIFNILIFDVQFLQLSFYGYNIFYSFNSIPVKCKQV